MAVFTCAPDDLTCAPNDQVELHLPTLFQAEQCGNTVVITSVGDSTRPSDEEFTAAVEQLRGVIEPDTKAVVVDMKDSDVHSSDRLIGPLIVLWNCLRFRGGKMAICGLGEYGEEVLHRTRLHLLWKVCPTREEAFKAVR